ncbi:class I SAM-dependent methyltransferase family protein [Pseudanabaena sp. FACHB-2040]|uniref:class I SAM-dependent methyltransferase family protein n=1 Tax=Pseudanabaena sp. FACHB-2040 TaxID=2692859 RepID=UPI001683522A|nr:class I SAM-dependent methyltransferase family protein [Pseudanabaena sp. FACHB-2040]MBD2258006.1 class I SAM-dependent methyltransferase family protein [Pseudanabaena sp. FACHB-2040]
MLQKSLPAYEDLLRPLPAWNPKTWYYRLLGLSLKTAGKLSSGIRLGFRYGFDSGVMLEYVYRNQPSGITPVGMLIDWIYLNSQGWRGIRQRSELLKNTLRQVLQTYRQQGLPCNLLDVACGGGRYDLEVLQAFPPEAIKATLRDYKLENVSKARQLARQLGVAAHIEQADAFNDGDLNQVHPRPTVVVVSGLHEILPNDALIRHHFQQLYRIMDTRSTLIFTIQPHHPQLELIARTLPAHTGRPWVMRLRSWELTHQWAEAAGFQNFQVWMEPNGIFGVVVAEKQL